MFFYVRMDGGTSPFGRYVDSHLSDFSDSETLEMDEMYTVPEVTPEARRSSLEEPADVKADEKRRKRPKPYRRSHSLAEIRRPTAIFIPEGMNHSLY